MPREPSLPPPESTIATARASAVLRQRAEEHVDRQRQLLLAVALAQQQPAARDDHLLLGRNQIDVVGLDRHAVLDEVDRQRGVPRQQLVHQALEVGRQVLDDDERHPGVARDVVEEALERFEAAGRRADADDEARRRSGFRAAHGNTELQRRNAGWPALRGLNVTQP